MRKVLMTAAVSFMSFSGLFAQENTVSPSNQNAPVLSFETEVIDYGTIEQGADGNREFKFTNTGREPLIISNARGSCGCTVPTWPKTPIAPGASDVIKVHYDTKRIGPINKSVTVTSNASQATIVLRIKGTVKAPTPVQTTPVNENENHTGPTAR